VGESVIISGTLTESFLGLYPKGLEGVQVSLCVDGVKESTVITGTGGTYRIEWVPSREGEYKLYTEAVV
jgi:hypothetical protein